MDFTKEISGKKSDNEEDSAEDRMMKVEALKAEKRKLKGAITRELNELASRVAGVSDGVEPRSFEAGEGKRRGLGPRNDVLTTCKAVT